MSRSGIALVLLVLPACRERPAVSDTAAPTAPTAPPAFTEAALGDAAPATEPGWFPPLEAPSWIVPLAVEGFQDALVAVPVGSRTKRPVIVALHGNFDRAEWTCGSFRGVAGPDPFILCPRGAPRTDAPPSEPRWTYSGAPGAAKEVTAALVALRAKYGDRIAGESFVYAGFSLGAIVGVPLVTREAARFPRVALVEGGHSGWTAQSARAFVQAGGERVLFVCAQPGCRGDAARAASTLRAAGALAKVVYAGNLGHRYDGEVAAATRTEWPWLTEVSAPH